MFKISCLKYFCSDWTSIIYDSIEDRYYLLNDDIMKIPYYQSNTVQLKEVVKNVDKFNTYFDDVIVIVEWRINYENSCIKTT